VFRGGHEIGSAVILYGTDGKPTPTGSFTILEKDAHHYSRSYDAPMPYMLRLTSDGVAIHGSNVRQGYATHGCIGVPPDFARLLFGAAAKGDTVVILAGDARKA
jgi:lipoprotein-anchoring transpeptidase ErfK/SrfK